ncbi:MAG TPA: acylneuraminate cytidylyltransferase family protein [Methyloceanibacter sp.]|nr:acylneuraminate cytidylyltransferase family protein [Methyloceanibacter sp.]
MTELLILVPARGGSKRVPGKNLRLFGDRPLLAHTAAAITESGIEAPVLLTTDDAAIAALGRELGWIVPFLRPDHLAGDLSPSIDAVIHALDWFAAERGGDPDLVLVLQPTSPLRGGACLSPALELLRHRPDLDSVVGTTALHIPPANLYFADDDGRAIPIAKSDQRRPVYVPNGAVYIARTQAVRRDHTLYAGTIAPLVMDKARSLDVDTETDFLIGEALLAAGLPEPQTSPASPSRGT